jgi:flagellar protein FlgJ
MNVSAIASMASASPHGAERLSHLTQADQVKAAAGQFEAILVRQFLQESVGKIMGGQDGGAASGVYGYMLTDVLASKLTEGSGLGLGQVIERQLTPRHLAAHAPQKGNPS